MSFLRDECKHLVVVLGLSVDYSVTKRCSVASVGHMCFVGMQRSPGNTGDKRHNTEKHDCHVSSVATPLFVGYSITAGGLLQIYTKCAVVEMRKLRLRGLQRQNSTEVFASQTTASVLSVSRHLAL